METVKGDIVGSAGGRGLPWPVRRSRATGLRETEPPDLDSRFQLRRPDSGHGRFDRRAAPALGRCRAAPRAARHLPFKSIRFNPDGSGVALGTSDGVAFLSTDQAASPRPGPKGPKAPQKSPSTGGDAGWPSPGVIIPLSSPSVSTTSPRKALAKPGGAVRSVLVQSPAGPLPRRDSRRRLGPRPRGAALPRRSRRGPRYSRSSPSADPDSQVQPRRPIPCLRLQSGDLSVKIWDVARAREHLTLFGHTARVWDVQFSPDGGLLAYAATTRPYGSGARRPARA